jgi:hypothetical protein
MNAREVPTYPEYVGLRAMAEESARRDGHFIDPVKLRMYQDLRRDFDWRICVLGHEMAVSDIDMHMLLLANGQDIDPPMPLWLAECRGWQEEGRRRDAARRAARLRARDEAWESIWKRMPQSIEVAYNYSGGLHLENYSSGADHIILTADLVVGRALRMKGWALCSTASASRHQYFPNPDPPARRVATCKACLRMAARVVGIEVPAILLEMGRR